jgi:hypothetical protein
MHVWLNPRIDMGFGETRLIVWNSIGLRETLVCALDTDSGFRENIDTIKGELKCLVVALHLHPWMR